MTHELGLFAILPGIFEGSDKLSRVTLLAQNQISEILESA